MDADVAFAGFAIVRPGLLAHQGLSEAVRAIAVGWNAPVALPTVSRWTVTAVEANLRPSVLQPRAARLGLAPASCPPTTYRQQSPACTTRCIYGSILSPRILP